MLIGTALEVHTNFKEIKAMEIWKPIEDLPGYSVRTKDGSGKTAQVRLWCLAKTADIAE